MYKRSWLWVIPIVIVLALALTACGKGPDESEPANMEQQQPQQQAVAAHAGDAAKGKELYSTTCIACHGEGGVGIEKLGKPMTTSKFIAGLDDEKLLAFIKQGRDPSSPDNTTGVAMPPKGGNPALSDAQLTDIIAYVRTLNKP